MGDSRYIVASLKGPGVDFNMQIRDEADLGVFEVMIENMRSKLATAEARDDQAKRSENAGGVGGA